jgi:hypothetical protein
MSALDLTPDEEALVLDALRTRANHYNAMFSSTDVALEALIAKVQAQLPQPEPVVVVESEPAATEVVEPETTVEATEEAPTEE